MTVKAERETFPGQCWLWWRQIAVPVWGDVTSGITQSIKCSSTCLPPGHLREHTTVPGWLKRSLQKRGGNQFKLKKHYHSSSIFFFANFVFHYNLLVWVLWLLFVSFSHQIKNFKMLGVKQLGDIVLHRCQIPFNSSSSSLSSVGKQSSYQIWKMINHWISCIS